VRNTTTNHIKFSRADAIFAWNDSRNQNQSYLTTESQSASLSWCQATIKARDQFSSDSCGVCCFVAPSLTRGRVCNLLSLFGLASAVPLRSESCESQEHILLSQCFRLLQPGGPDPFPLPLTNRRATVVVFQPASTQRPKGDPRNILTFRRECKQL
jgi:hypothetical protein